MKPSETLDAVLALWGSKGESYMSGTSKRDADGKIIKWNILDALGEVNSVLRWDDKSLPHPTSGSLEWAELSKATGEYFAAPLPANASDEMKRPTTWWPYPTELASYSTPFHEVRRVVMKARDRLLKSQGEPNGNA